MKNIRIIFLILFGIFTFANSLELDDLKIFEDKENIYTIETILKNKNLFQEVKKTNLGIKKHNIWTSAKIENNTNSLEKIILTNPRAGIDFIDVFLLSENKIIKKALLGDMRPQKEREFLYRKSSFLVTLEPNTKYEIFVKYKSFGAIDINWKKNNVFEYITLISNESLIFGFIAGFVVLISSYIIFVDRLFPTISNKIYLGIMISTLLMQFSIAGIFYQMGLNSYINTLLSWCIGTLGAALVGFFPIYFFNLKKIMPKTTIILYVLSYILIGFSILFLFYPLKNDLLYLGFYTNLILFILIIILLYISIRLYLKKINGAFFYLLANTFFTSSAIYLLLGLTGIIKVKSLFYFSLGIGSILNILCIGMLIVARLIQMKVDKENALVLLNEYSKLSNIGQSMVNITHQWKEPINHIYYAMNNIYAAKEFNDPDLANIIDKSLEQIKTTTIHMTNTGERLLHLYEDTNSIENIDISNSISSSIKILKNQINDLNINIISQTKGKYFIFTDKYLISNIFLILLENAIKTFKSRKISNPFIKIETIKKDTQIIIKISDNAGGIKINQINKVFEKDLSTFSSTGLGLFLAKSILTMKLNGDISVKNTVDGACFTIIFNV